MEKEVLRLIEKARGTPPSGRDMQAVWRHGWPGPVDIMMACVGVCSDAEVLFGQDGGRSRPLCNAGGSRPLCNAASHIESGSHHALTQHGRGGPGWDTIAAWHVIVAQPYRDHKVA